MPKPENATELLNFRVTPSERKTIEKAARRRGIRLSDYCRERLLPHDDLPPHSDKEEAR